MSLHRSIALPIAALLAASVIGAAWLGHWFHATSLRTAVMAQEEDHVTRVAQRLIAALEDRVGQVTRIARGLRENTSLHDALATYRQDNDDRRLGVAITRLVGTLQIPELLILDPHGRVIFQTHAAGRAADAMFLPDALAHTPAINVVYARTDSRGLTLNASTVVESSGQHLGTVVAGVHIGDEALIEYQRGQESSMVLLAHDEVIASSIPRTALDPDRFGATALRNSGRSYGFAWLPDSRKAMLVVPFRLSDTELTGVVEADVTDSLQLLSEQRYQSLVAMLVLVIAALGIAMPVVIRLTRPLKDLRARVESATSEVIPIDPAMTRGNEVEAVVRLVNHTTTELVRAHRTLRDREAALVRAREEAERSRAFLADLIDLFPGSVFVKDERSRYVMVNAAHCRMLGKERAALLGRRPDDHLPAAFAASIIEADRGVMASGLQADLEESYTDHHGTVRWLRTHKRQARMPDGRPAVLGVIIDLTDHRRLEDQLRRNEETFRAVFERANVGMTIRVPGDPRWRQVNDHFCAMLGRSREELLAGAVLDFVPVELHAEVQAVWDQLDRERMAAHLGERCFVHRDGSLVWTAMSMSRIHDAETGGDLVMSVFTDITERRNAVEASHRARTEAESARAFLDALMNALPSAIVVKDAAGAFLTFNDTQCRMMGRTREEGLGKNSFAIFPEAQARTLTDGDRRALDEDTLQEFELALTFPDGTEHWMHMHKRPLQLPDGRRVLLSVATDLTARRQADEAMRAAHDAAEAASRAKSEFVANMNHEIRTPMNGVLGMTDLLLDSPLDERQQRFAQNIRTSAETLLTIVNDILDFSKIESGRMDLEAIDFDPREIVEEVGELLAARAHAKGIELITRVANDLPPRLNGDPNRLRQVLINLAGNAVKFTAAGEVIVEANPCEAPVGSQVCLVVADTGIGISRDAQARLFSPFHQADGSMSRRYGGTGLGLAIARQLVELMGGTIAVESAPGQGSRFTVRVPLRPATTPADPSPARMLDGQHVLVVVERPSLFSAIAHLLEGWGARATGVRSVEAARTLLSDAHAAGQPFTVLLANAELPDESSLDLVAALRRDPRFSSLPAVILTSAGHPATPEPSLPVATSCMPKPVRRGELLRHLLRHAAPQGAMNAPPVNTSAPPGALQRIDARILVAEDNAINQEMCRAMLRALGCTTEIVPNGAEALRRLSTARFDLVLMDCQMPEMDGFEATRAIRANEAASAAAKRIPIVALTANAMAGDRERCLEAGMDDYVSKPFRKAHLAEVLARWLADRKPIAVPDTSADAPR